MKTPLIIGHRGASAVAPENTMAAFREAIAAGCDGIEFDVRLTHDGVPVVIHDNTLRRTAGLAARVADLTWAEIKQINVGSWFTRSRTSFANETVPSLEELLTLFESNNLLIVLEMKCESRAEHMLLAEACCRLINEHSLKQRVIVECFDLAALPIVKDIDPEIKTAALFEPAFSLSDQRIIDKAIEVGASVLAPHHRLARQSLIEKAKLAGLQLTIWTVDDPSWIAHARSIGVDALITNDPAAMLAHR
ncbi:MAG TPA: glycerophosphodiester phosphodiesterase family protein [Pyrinomonadaceae bacterium]|nr:glycerophosphodiester phosphodiesterase family protein [Pyrinomonadaceae bacterium]